MFLRPFNLIGTVLELGPSLSVGRTRSEDQLEDIRVFSF